MAHVTGHRPQIADRRPMHKHTTLPRALSRSRSSSLVPALSLFLSLASLALYLPLSPALSLSRLLSLAHACLVLSIASCGLSILLLSPALARFRSFSLCLSLVSCALSQYFPPRCSHCRLPRAGVACPRPALSGRSLTSPISHLLSPPGGFHADAGAGAGGWLCTGCTLAAAAVCGRPTRRTTFCGTSQAATRPTSRGTLDHFS